VPSIQIGWGEGCIRRTDRADLAGLGGTETYVFIRAGRLLVSCQG